MAAQRGYTDIVTILLENKADANIADEGDYLPLHLAISDKVELVLIKLLVNATKNINAQNDEKMTPLAIAASVGRPDIVELLLNNDADPNIEDEERKLPIHWAVESNDLDSLKILVEKNGVRSDEDIEMLLEMASEFNEIEDYLNELKVRRGAK